MTITQLLGISPLENATVEFKSVSTMKISKAG